MDSIFCIISDNCQFVVNHMLICKTSHQRNGRKLQTVTQAFIQCCLSITKKQLLVNTAVVRQLASGSAVSVSSGSAVNVSSGSAVSVSSVHWPADHSQHLPFDAPHFTLTLDSTDRIRNRTADKHDVFSLE